MVGLFLPVKNASPERLSDSTLFAAIGGWEAPIPNSPRLAFPAPSQTFFPTTSSNLTRMAIADCGCGDNMCHLIGSLSC